MLLLFIPSVFLLLLISVFFRVRPWLILLFVLISVASASFRG